MGLFFCWAFLAVPELFRGPLPELGDQGLWCEDAHSSTAVPKQAGCDCGFSSPGLWLFSSGQRSRQRLLTCQSAENRDGQS